MVTSLDVGTGGRAWGVPSAAWTAAFSGEGRETRTHVVGRRDPTEEQTCPRGAGDSPTLSPPRSAAWTSAAQSREASVIPYSPIVSMSAISSV